MLKSLRIFTLQLNYSVMEHVCIEYLGGWDRRITSVRLFWAYYKILVQKCQTKVKREKKRSQSSQEQWVRGLKSCSCWEEKLGLNLGLMTIISYWAVLHHFIISCYMLKCRTLKLNKISFVTWRSLSEKVLGNVWLEESLLSMLGTRSGRVAIKCLREGRESTKEAQSTSWSGLELPEVHQGGMFPGSVS